MAAVHILIFGKMVGFKIVPFIATHGKMEKKKKKSCSYEKKKKKKKLSQSELANSHENN